MYVIYFITGVIGVIGVIVIVVARVMDAVISAATIDYFTSKYRYQY